MKFFVFVILVFLIHAQEAFSSTHITVFFPYKGFSVGLTGSAGKSSTRDADKESSRAIDRDSDLLLKKLSQ